MKCICFFGDSLALGVNDRKMQGWTGRWHIRAQEAMEDNGAGFPALTTYNLGVRKNGSPAVRERWEEELAARILDGAEMMSVFCFGVVDAATPTGTVNVPVAESIAHARAILTGAQEKSRVMMISPPPVADAAHTGRIVELSAAYRDLCDELGVPYCDMLPTLRDSEAYMGSLSDGIHPGEAGCEVFAEALFAFAPLTRWLLAG